MSQKSRMARGDGSGPIDRADLFFRADPGNDLLSTVITSHTTFWATVRNAAALHSVNVDHLATALRLAGEPGVVVTARLIYSTAAALEAAGYGERRAS